MHSEASPALFNGMYIHIKWEQEVSHCSTRVLPDQAMSYGYSHYLAPGEKPLQGSRNFEVAFPWKAVPESLARTALSIRSSRGSFICSLFSQKAETYSW